MAGRALPVLSGCVPAVEFCCCAGEGVEAGDWVEEVVVVVFGASEVFSPKA